MEEVKSINTIEDLYELYKERLSENGVPFTLHYNAIDGFYAFVGYDLGLNHLLIKLGVDGTSDLKEKFVKLYFKEIKESKLI